MNITLAAIMICSIIVANPMFIALHTIVVCTRACTIKLHVQYYEHEKIMQIHDN